jgi:hypothetical protein
MRLKRRSFPHPVLGNEDDVQGTAMQVAFEVNFDKKNYYLKSRFDCSNQTLGKLIAEGKAAYVTHVECTNTLFRSRFASAEREQTLPITADDLNNTVEVNFFLCAIQPISGYQVEGSHPDYGNSVFAINKGDILAIADGRTFNAERDANALRRVSSIMQIEESRDEGDAPMQISFNQAKIRIVLSKPDFADYKILKTQEHLQSALSATIVLPALAEALHIIRDEGDEYSSYRWHQNLKHRLEEMGIGDGFEPFIAAQKLLELPLRRALQQAKSALINSL